MRKRNTDVPLAQDFARWEVVVHPATVGQKAIELGDNNIKGADMLENLVGDDQIEGAVGEWHGFVLTEMLHSSLINERGQFRRVVAPTSVEYLRPVAVHAPAP